MPDSPDHRHAGTPEHNPWAVLAVLCTSIFMLLLDTTVVNNAQRKIQIGLRADLTEIQWILDSYLLVYAVLLLSFGRLGDILGRKSFFIAGVVIFLGFLLLAAGLVGVGSSIFHPEASRIARLASGGRHGLAQSVFQVGGNAGTAIGPLLAAAIVVPYGQHSIIWFSVIAMAAIAVLWRVSHWYRHPHFTATRKPKPVAAIAPSGIGHTRVVLSLVVLVVLVFSKFFYLESLRSYYTFFLIDRYGLEIPVAQMLLFVFLFSFAAGTLIGGPLGDRIGRKYVIWGSILGILPFTLALPHVGLVWTVILTIPIGIGLASAFPAIIVFAQELVPGKTGMVSGIFFGLAFGMGGIGAAALGELADMTSIEFVYNVCAWLPAIGLLTIFLPNIEGTHPGKKRAA